MPVQRRDQRQLLLAGQQVDQLILLRHEADSALDGRGQRKAVVAEELRTA